MKRSSLLKAMTAALTAAVVFTSVPAAALAECTQFWVPSMYTENGSNYIGRDEDYSYRYFKRYGIEPSMENVTYFSDETNFTWTSDKTSYRYSYVRDAADQWDDCTNAYSSAGINEKGVSCSATLSTSYGPEAKAADPLNGESGIGEYSYASIILGESATAREGVELVGRLVEQYGACSCDQIAISDNTESWIVTVLSGHQWIAIKLPGDKASVNPNLSNLRFSADLDNPEVCLHSDTVVSMPQEKGFLKTFADGTPDIIGTYGKADDAQSASSLTRLAQGREYFGAPLEEGTYTFDASAGGVTKIDTPTLFFTPGKSNMSTFEIIRALGTRGEGTKFDANVYGFYAIGNNRQPEGHMFEIRPNMSADVATIQWQSLSRSEFSVAIPLYSALITEPSEYFLTEETTSDHCGSNKAFKDPVTGPEKEIEQAMQEEPANSIDFVMMDINTLCYNNRSTCAEGMRAYLDALQNELIEQNKDVDAAIIAASGDERSELATKAGKVATEQTYKKCKAALDELRAYLKAGNFDEPFVPSDYDAEARGLKQSITYASEVVPAPEPKPEPKPETKPATTPAAKPSTNGTVSAGSTPQTGDATDFTMVASVAGIGVVIAGAAYAMKRRNN